MSVKHFMAPAKIMDFWTLLVMDTPFCVKDI